MKTLSYKPGVEEVVERLRMLYERRASDRILATMSVPSPTLAEFARRYPRPECTYPDPVERAEYWDNLWGERAAVEDDSMPAAYLSEFDQGLYGGLLGGEVRFLAHRDSGWVSSMVLPLLTDWSQFDGLRCDASGIWWQRYCRQLDVFVNRGLGKWGVSHLIAINGLNAVFELVGATRTYLSLEPLERLVGKFDGGVIHVHGNGRHLLEAAATIKGLKTVLLMDDRGFATAFEVIADLKARLGDVPVAVFADYPQFAERLERHDLPGGVLYQVKNVPDVHTANRLMEKVRKYRAGEL
jgi:hypothetical protein